MRPACGSRCGDNIEADVNVNSVCTGMNCFRLGYVMGFREFGYGMLELHQGGECWASAAVINFM